MQNRVTDHIRSNVIGFVALFVALTGGVAYATHPGGANTISSADIINGEVKTGDIGDLEVRANDVAADSLGSAKIANGSVKNIDLGLGASSSNTIADGGIQGIDVKNNTLTGTQIDEATLTGVPSTNAWGLTGNSGTTGANFLGTTDNQALNLRVNDARALRLEPASDGTNQSPNVIGGSADNQVSPGAFSATISGGGRSDPADPATANEVTDDYGTIGGGGNNVASAPAATVAGGFDNTASGTMATAVGGGGNFAAAPFSLAGGRKAHADHQGAFVWADSSPGFFLSPTFSSTAQDQFSVRATGGTRLVSAVNGLSGAPTAGLELLPNTSGLSTLGGSQPFDVSVNGSRGLRIDPASDGTNQSPNVIGGIADNQVTPGVHSATIAGGGRGTPTLPGTANRVTDHQGTIGGGANNQAGDGAGNAGDRTLATVGGGGNNDATGEAATVAGGFDNTASGSRAAVGGGDGNVASGSGATVGGGVSIEATGNRATVGGGRDNAAGGDRATVGGGDRNTASHDLATVGGGFQNTAGGLLATVGGGDSNSAGEIDATVGGGFSNNASGNSATIGGGGANNASGAFATVPGGNANTAEGSYSLAAGHRAQANHGGSFVWADGEDFNFPSTAFNQFSARSTGGARFVSAIDPMTGAPTAGVSLAPGGGSWSSLSDAASKRAIEPVSGREVLRELASVPISTWSYDAQDASIRHIGPMAQDFFRAFGVGEDRRHISSVDADGVALAAIKGLQHELRAERRRRHEQERRLARLEARLAALEERGRR